MPAPLENPAPEPAWQPPAWDPYNVLDAIRSVAAPEPVYMLLEAHGGEPYGPPDELIRRLGVERQALVDSVEEYQRWKASGRKFMPDEINPVR